MYMVAFLVVRARERNMAPDAVNQDWSIEHSFSCSHSGFWDTFAALSSADINCYCKKHVSLTPTLIATSYSAL